MKILISILFVLFINSCRTDNNSENKISETTVTDTSSNMSDKSINVADSQNVLYVKSNSLVFFSLSEKEFRQFLHRTGHQSEWDFGLIFKEFKQRAKKTKKALKNINVNTFYTINPKIAFITNSGDTLYFNRKENNLFVGQIFFNGEDTFDIEEGLMKRDSLQNRIVHFFKLKEDINIKQTIIHVETQKVIKKDTLKESSVDTLINP